MGQSGSDRDEVTPPRCPECGFDLSGVAGGECPECGWAIEGEYLRLTHCERLMRRLKSPAEPTPGRTLLKIAVVGVVLFVLLTGLAAVAALVWILFRGAAG